MKSARDIFRKLLELNEFKQTNNQRAIVDLTLGQPHLPVNPAVMKALASFISDKGVENQFGYSNVPGRRTTLQAICQLMKLYFPKLQPSEKQVMCTNGANQGLWNAFSALLKNGDSVVLFAPYFGQYKTQLESLGINVVTIKPKNKLLRPNLEQLEHELKVNPKIKAIILNNPVNPSGVIWSYDELEYLKYLLNCYTRILVIQDEVYRDIAYEEFYSLLDVSPELFNRIVTIFSCSKGVLGAPDLRVGMVFASEDMIKKFSNYQMMVSAEASFITQKILTYAISAKVSQSKDFLCWEEKARKAYFININYVVKALSGAAITLQNSCQAGFFVLMNFSALLNSKVPTKLLAKNKDQAISYLKNDMDIVKLLLYSYDIAGIPGSFCGLDTYDGILRISCASNFENIQFFVQQIKQLICDFDLDNYRSKDEQSLEDCYYRYG